MDPKVAMRLAEGQYAATALDLLAELLGALVEESLRAADSARIERKLSPETALAILHEIGAYRTTSSPRRCPRRSRPASCCPKPTSCSRTRKRGKPSSTASSPLARLVSALTPKPSSRPPSASYRVR